MKILVTGGAGFIASHIVDVLVEDGHEVLVVDDLSNGRSDRVNPQARVYQVDIADSDGLRDVFDREKPDIVNHHAALTSVRHSMSGPEVDARVNIIGTINVLQNCVAHGVQRLVFASSGAVYAEPQYIPMDEGHPIAPKSAYGLSKYTAEGYIRLYADVYGLRHTIFRYGNVFGPRQDPRGEAGVVAIFTEQLLNGIQPTIFGDGTKTRDYVFVEDISRANLMATIGSSGNDTLNLARGVEVSDFEVFDAVRGATGTSVEPVYSDKRPGEADRSSLDCSRAEQVLGWTPWTTFRAGVDQVVAHMRAGGG